MRSKGPAVLLYHDVGSRGGTYCVKPEVLGRHLELVADQGASVVRAGDISPARGSIAITFDDGAYGVVRHGLAVLAEAGMVATVFVTASMVGEDGFMSARELKKWSAAGNEVGTHGWVHESLSSMPLERALEDLSRSKAFLEGVVEEEIRSVSFPNGRLSRALVRGAGEMGLTMAFGSWPGYGRGRKGAFGRFSVVESTSVRAVRSVLAGGGALSYAPQRALFLLGRTLGEDTYRGLRRVIDPLAGRLRRG